MTNWLVWFEDVLNGYCRERFEESKYNWSEKEFNECLSGVVMYLESK